MDPVPQRQHCRRTAFNHSRIYPFNHTIRKLRSHRFLAITTGIRCRGFVPLVHFPCLDTDTAATTAGPGASVVTRLETKRHEMGSDRAAPWRTCWARGASRTGAGKCESFRSEDFRCRRIQCETVANGFKIIGNEVAT